MSRPLLLAIFGAIVVVAAIILNFVLEPGGDEAVAPPTAAPAKQAPATAAIPKSTKPTNVPTFDVVRINPKGDTVMAGRAKPGSKVEIYDGDKLIGEVTADARGEWVFVPDKPLPPGNRELSLVMIDKDGKRIKSESVVMLAVPKPGTTVAGAPSTSPEQPLALKVPRSGLGGSVVLQRPRADGSVPGPLTVDTIDYDDLGNLDISGHAEAGAQVYLYLNNEFLGHATAGTSNGDGISVGVWREKPEKRAAPGVYTLRADQVDKSGKVMARIEVVFARSVPLTDVKPGSFVVVESGNSLWRLARRAYGTGLNYTVIYKANKNQIKDADLIYPGQVFSLPSIN